MEKESEFKIREATSDDAAKARSMQAESWLATYPSEKNGVPYEWVKQRTDKWMTPENLEESKQIIAKVLGDSNQFYRLAEKNGEVVGFVHVLTKDDGTKQLGAIYTNPRTLGSGIAQRLMGVADEWIDGTQTTLEVVSYNDRAIRFYEKHGFKKVEGSEHMYADKMPVINMMRERG